MRTAKRIMLMLSLTAPLCCLLSVAAFAAGSGDVAGAVERFWLPLERGMRFHWCRWKICC